MHVSIFSPNKVGMQRPTDIIAVLDKQAAPESRLYEEAGDFARRLRKKQGRQPEIVLDMSDLKSLLANPRSDDICKLHLIGHCTAPKSNTRPVTFGDHDFHDLLNLFGRYLPHKNNLRKISLNGCHSGETDDQLNPSLSEKIANGLSLPQAGLRIGGFYGFAVMQRDGKNCAISEIRPVEDHQENRWNKNHAQPRPVFRVGDPNGNEAIRIETAAAARQMRAKTAGCGKPAK